MREEIARIIASRLADKSRMERAEIRSRLDALFDRIAVRLPGGAMEDEQKEQRGCDQDGAAEPRS